METAFAMPVGVTATAAVLGAVLASILPTCLYLYVEPRGRRHWAALDGHPSGRKAPALVRFTAWMSFFVGQLALPWLLVPGLCAGLLYLQVKLGAGGPVGFVATVAVGCAALVESLLSLRLLPVGVRLLACDAKLGAGAAARARSQSTISVAVLAGCASLSWLMTTLPHGVHPWLRAALLQTALRPAMAYAAVCVLHALLLGRCARALSASPASREPRARSGLGGG